MRFSILYDSSDEGLIAKRPGAPECFRDLNLDQIVETVTAGWETYDLLPIFYSPLPSAEAIRYRHEVFRDLEDSDVFACVTSFCARMRQVRGALLETRKLHYELQKQRQDLDTVGEYCEAVNALTRALTLTDLRSHGLVRLREYLGHYTRSMAFGSLAAETETLQADLSAITYTLSIHGKRIAVSRYGGESDYAAQVLETFAKFRQASVQQAEFTFRSHVAMNHIEEAIVDRVARLFPETFSALARYCERHRDFLDPEITGFERDAQFYLAWLEYVRPLEKAGLRVCYPEVCQGERSSRCSDTFDLALAHRLVAGKEEVVLNEFELRAPERIMVVSGANQGGKTTFARLIGQMHYLAGIGCLVAGREATLPFVDRVLTHFEREERVETLSGKLEESLQRMRRLLEQATSSSILIMNESFDSTTVSDALFLSREILSRVISRGMLCVCVTFLDELTLLCEKTVSYVATVDVRDPAKRTYKLVRKPAEGLAYATAIAEKYELTYERVKERIGG
ncbi:MAG: MutS-related protein [Steroidobacteraceae bacterium]